MKRAFLVFVLSAAGCVTAPEIPADIRVQTRRIEVGGEVFPVDFYYRTGAQRGPLAVVVHGFLADKERMAHWGLILAREGFVAAVPTNPTFANDERNVSAIVGLVRAGNADRWPVPVCGDGRAVVVGFSRGGYETLLAAAELGSAVDAWVGLDPVDRDGKGTVAVRKIRVSGVALMADPAPLNANGNARRMLTGYAGPLEVVRIPDSAHLDAESPRRESKFDSFRTGVLVFLNRVVPRD